MRNYLANSPNKPKTIFSHSYGAVVEAIMEKATGRQGGCAEQVHCEYISIGSAQEGGHMIRY